MGDKILYHFSYPATPDVLVEETIEIDARTYTLLSDTIESESVLKTFHPTIACQWKDRARLSGIEAWYNAEVVECDI